MKKQGCKTLFIILAALLCLFSASGVILGKMFSPADVSAKAGEAGEAGNAGEAGDAGDAGDAVMAVKATDTEQDAKTVDTSTDEAPAESTVRKLSCRYFNEKEFLKSVNQTASPTASSISETSDAPNGQIKGGIVPHHLLAGKMIAAFFSTLAQDPPGTIILVGPNHKLIGASGIHTSAQDWGTAFGTLEADREIVGELAEKMKASENNALMENEHSISSLVPYIKYYMPDTKIVPVLLHGSYTQEQSKELGSLLAEIISEKPDAIILASIDFSHYLDVIEADKMDDDTLAAISSWNIDELSRMNNDNLDSVPSATTLLTAMDTIGAKDIDVMGHSNSSRIAGSGYDYTTSYFTMLFRLQD